MARVISCINMKGGVGKTTLSAELSMCAAEEHDLKVLAVDIDPQFNLSTYLMRSAIYLKHIKSKSTVAAVFSDQLGKPSVAPSRRASRKAALDDIRYSVGVRRGSLDLLPGTLDLAALDTSKRGTERRLKNFLDRVHHMYNLVVIDCPPTAGILPLAGLIASDSYIVPVKPDPLSTIGLPLLERWMNDASEDYDLELQSLGMVFCMVRKSVSESDKVMEDLREKRGDEVFSSLLSLSTAFASAVKDHESVRNKQGRYGNEVRAVTREFLERAEII